MRCEVCGQEGAPRARLEMVLDGRSIAAVQTCASCLPKALPIAQVRALGKLGASTIGGILRRVADVLGG